MRLVKFCNSDNYKKLTLLEALSEQEQLNLIKQLLGDKLKVAINDVKFFDKEFSKQLSGFDTQLIIQLLQMIDKGEVEILKKFEGDILKTYISKFLPPSVVTLFTESALSAGYKLSGNLVVFSDPIIQQLFNTISNNKKIFTDDKIIGQFVSIIIQVYLKDSKVLNYLKLISDDELDDILLIGDKDIPYRIKSWLFLSDSRNRLDYGLPDTMDDGIFSEVNINGQTVKLSSLLSEKIKSYLSTFLKKSMTIDEWFVENKIYSDKDKFADTVSKLRKFVKDNKGQKDTLKKLDKIKELGENNKVSYRIMDKFSDLSVDTYADKERIIRIIDKFFSALSIDGVNSDDVGILDDEQTPQTKDKWKVKELLDELGQNNNYILKRIVELSPQVSKLVNPEDVQKQFSNDEVINLVGKSYGNVQGDNAQERLDNILKSVIRKKLNLN